MRTKEKEREELKAKIRMVMEANGKSMTAKEVSEHPTMSGITGQQIGQTMRHMTGFTFGKGKRWSMRGPKTKVKAKPKKKYGPYPKKKKQQLSEVIKEWDGQNTRFRITKEGKLFLSINGISFPVEVEG